jgi:hypothetical protein
VRSNLNFVYNSYYKRGTRAVFVRVEFLLQHSHCTGARWSRTIFVIYNHCSLSPVIFKIYLASPVFIPWNWIWGWGNGGHRGQKWSQIIVSDCLNCCTNFQNLFSLRCWIKFEWVPPQVEYQIEKYLNRSYSELFLRLYYLPSTTWGRGHSLSTFC